MTPYQLYALTRGENKVNETSSKTKEQKNVRVVNHPSESRLNQILGS